MPKPAIWAEVSVADPKTTATTAPADEYRTPSAECTAPFAVEVGTPTGMIVTLAAVAMTQEDAHEVFGSLPRRRPGIVSPRRAAARKAGPEEPAAAAPAAKASRSEIAELEELALAGARLAAGAAASGLRLAGRTVGGIGRVVGRR